MYGSDSDVISVLVLCELLYVYHLCIVLIVMFLTVLVLCELLYVYHLCIVLIVMFLTGLSFVSC